MLYYYEDLTFSCCVRVTEVRQQLSDQLRCLDQRVDYHLGMVSELQEYYQRHSEIEAELSRSLDKLDKQIRARHKAEKQRQDPLLSLQISNSPNFSTRN